MGTWIRPHTEVGISALDRADPKTRAPRIIIGAHSVQTPPWNQCSGPGDDHCPIAGYSPSTLALRVLALAVVMGVLAVTIRVGGRRRADPDQVWADAERAFLAGHWDRARTSLRQLESARDQSRLDWMLEAQLATAEGRSSGLFGPRRRSRILIRSRPGPFAGRSSSSPAPLPPEGRGSLSTRSIAQARPDRGSQGTRLHPWHPVAPPGS